jgi:NADH:ubiquinone oxidoreductase subunit 5 (subunit L)/multisubunit Na+/H+ antiporter MnhA subunit
VHRFLENKWWFDELYQAVFVRPALYVSQRVADLDRRGIDGLADSLARGVRLLSSVDDRIDRWFVDGLVNGTARVIFATGIWLRNLQTGNLRQYVMFMAVGVVALFVLISLYWNLAITG